MRYSIGDTLADYGFTFLEKLHHPLFLVHRSGKLKKVNEAGRKLIKIAHLSSLQLNELISSMNLFELSAEQVKYKSFRMGRANLKLVAKQMGSSDYILIELMHSLPAEQLR